MNALSPFSLPSLLVCFLFCTLTAFAQPNRPILTGYSGSELRAALRQQYRPDHVLSYGQARDTLYALIDRRGDSLYGIYTDYAHYLEPGADPTQYVYEDNNFARGMNCEHVFPQSMGGGEGNAKSDMHHLFPVRIDINAARGNRPYGEVPDWQTERWYAHDRLIEGSKPTDYLDQYSEWGGEVFEPREAVKGDIARAIFYIYTIYEGQVDRRFFLQQLPTLQYWHLQDPPDEREKARTWQIAYYQDNKPNPFVLDITLAARAFTD